MLAYSLSRTLREPVYRDLSCVIIRAIRSLTDISANLPDPAENKSKESTQAYRKVLSEQKIFWKYPYDRQSPSGKYNKSFQKYLKRKMSSSGGPPYNDLTYYTFGTPNGLKPAIVLEELELQYKAVPVDISKNAQKEEWFLAINPNGRIPALKDGDMRVFESGAIMLYLADNYDKSEMLTYKHGTPLYYEMLSWLMFQMAGIGPMQGTSHLILSSREHQPVEDSGRLTRPPRTRSLRAQSGQWRC
jgi:hypothetical protein